jgi:hypothetical protein
VEVEVIGGWAVISTYNEVKIDSGNHGNGVVGFLQDEDLRRLGEFDAPCGR